MTPRLPRITARDLLRALQRDGWQAVRQSGSHVVLHHPGKPGRVVVANHPGTVLALKTLQSILDDAGLSAEELSELL